MSFLAWLYLWSNDKWRDFYLLNENLGGIKLDWKDT